MFDPQSTPRVFAVPLGVPFADALLDGLEHRAGSSDQITLARTQVYLNTERLRRHVIDRASMQSVRLLPQLKLVTQLPFVGTDDAVSPLEQQLRLADLIRPYLKASPNLAPRQAAFDLAVSLSNLMDEMIIEGVSEDDISDLNVQDQSGYWRDTLKFLNIANTYVRSGKHVTLAQRSRMATDQLIQRWHDDAPNHPVIIAGSTGSRQTTFDLMAAACRLPNGAVILPGFDWNAPWSDLSGPNAREDHPQYRFAKFLDDVGLSPQQVKPWSHTAAPEPNRNALISLSLHPAPVTNRWLKDGPKLTGLDQALRNVTWIEAPDPRTEAQTIAAKIRTALEQDKTVAVISPDRMLTRRLTAALSKWGIVPDDSAGVPLSQTPPGRLLRELADMLSKPVTVPVLLSVLKHPLTHTGQDRGPHLKHTRDYELKLRREGPPFPDAADLMDWAADDADRADWARWVCNVIEGVDPTQPQSLADWTHDVRTRAVALSSGPSGATGTLWDEEAGRECLSVLDDLVATSDATGPHIFSDYAVVLKRLLQAGQIRQQSVPNPAVKFLGTLEARSQSADVVILAGLNEGVWPTLGTPDPWMNRAMRAEAGLLLPDRSVGLSAHDYQIAMANPDVWVTRSLRSADAETIPSRWLNRFANLLNGLSEDDTHPLWDAMTQRGAQWMAAAGALNDPIVTPPASRPSPCPPVDARPTKLPVTAITRLIRDPYAIYAQYILGLYPLDPLLAEPDALLRGNAVHTILEDTLVQGPFPDAHAAISVLMAETQRILTEQVPWPAERRRWAAMMARNATALMTTEVALQAGVMSRHSEIKGQALIPHLGFTLTAKADRIDLRHDEVVIYDYKTGRLPTKDSQKAFDKQLLLEIDLLKRGGFAGIDTKLPVRAEYVGVGSDLRRIEANTEDAGDSWQGLIKLIQVYQTPSQGYTARRAMLASNDVGRYDHLARYGEWDVTRSPSEKGSS